jgi:hypothetical protein
VVQTLEAPGAGDENQARPLQQTSPTEAQDTADDNHRWPNGAISQRGEVPRSDLRSRVKFQVPLERNAKEDIVENRPHPLSGKERGRRRYTHPQHVTQEPRSLNHHLRRNNLPQLQQVLEDGTNHTEPGAKGSAPCATIHIVKVPPRTTPRTETRRLLLANNSAILEQRYSTWQHPHSPHHPRNSQTEEQRRSSPLISINVADCKLNEQ